MITPRRMAPPVANPIPGDLLEVHRRYNQRSAALWEQFAPHRSRVTGLALGAPGPRLAVLGAGNCNDLDLVALASRFEEIHLADLDSEALRRARDRQPADLAQKLILHGSVDCSGALGHLPAFARQPPTRAQMAALPSVSAGAVRAALPGPFDTVLSAGLLSQIMHGCRLALGVNHPHLAVLARALAAGHLLAMAGLLRPGGTGLLVTDTATAEEDRLLERWTGSTPLALLERLQQEDELLSGTEPALLLGLLASDAALAPLFHPPQLVQPWLWGLGRQTLLVYALVLGRRG
jgi:hypothetical protein